MKILLIQSPRKYWPYLSHGDNYILPQWMPCLAAVLRESGNEIECIDCMALKIGWRSLEKLIREKAPEMVCISEAHALYMEESLKLVKLVKLISRNIKVVCGGGQFSNTVAESLKNPDIDIIVRGEGELTIVDLVKCLESGGNIESLNGISFMHNGVLQNNPPRNLIADLDTLPLPAYDLVPMKEYGKSRFLFSPGGITIHHSRGCPSNCRFCVWWTQMADRKIESGKEVLNPRWRTKSVEKTLEELEYLKKEYGRQCFIFVDGSWNIDPSWNEKFADEVIKRNLDIKWFAFMRVDCIIRDEKLGIMEKLVRSGLAHICVGAEHCCAEIMKDFGKTSQDRDITAQCISLMKEKYPSVFVQSTFIVGTRSESKKTLDTLTKYIKNLKVDYPAFHVFTPVPGTALYEEAKEKGWLEESDFSKYDWNTPIISTKHLSREDMEWELYYLYKSTATFKRIFAGLLTRNVYKRNMYLWWIIVSFRVVLSSMFDWVHPRRMPKRLVTPKWYDS